MKDSNLIPHTFSKSVWLYGTECFDKKDLVLYYDIAGNLGTCTLPYILSHKFSGKIPDGEKFTYFGVAAGGSLICMEFVHNQTTKSPEDNNIVEVHH